MSLLDASLLVALALGLAGGATLAILAAASLANDRSWKRRKRRLEALGRRALEIAPSSTRATAMLAVAQSPTPRLDVAVRRLLPGVAGVEALLARTGRAITIGQYGAAAGGLALALIVVAVVAADAPGLPALAVGLLAGALLPRLAIARLAGKRLAAFTGQFAEAIELIVRALRAGLPLSEAIHTVGSEFPEPVGGEFRRVAGALALGFQLEDALWSIVKRVDSPELRFFIVSISTQRQTGGNLGETLTNLADVLRARSQMRLKITAMTGEARARAMVLGSLPFAISLLMYLTNPQYITPLFVDPRGWMMLGAGLASLSVGAVIMAQLIKFEI